MNHSGKYAEKCDSKLKYSLTTRDLLNLLLNTDLCSIQIFYCLNINSKYYQGTSSKMMLQICLLAFQFGVLERNPATGTFYRLMAGFNYMFQTYHQRRVDFLR